MNKSAFQKGLKDGIPIGLGYFAVSFTFGIMAIQADLSALQAVLISLTNLTSAGQFAGIGIIAARRFTLGDGADSAGHQSSVLSDVFFTFTETGKGCVKRSPSGSCFWCD